MPSTAPMSAQDVRAETERLEDEHRREQAEAAATWQLLIDNDQDTVIAAVDRAFDDNQAPAAPVDVEGCTLSLVMSAPRFDETPQRKPALT